MSKFTADNSAIVNTAILWLMYSANGHLFTTNISCVLHEYLGRSFVVIYEFTKMKRWNIICSILVLHRIYIKIVYSSITCYNLYLTQTILKFVWLGIWISSGSIRTHVLVNQIVKTNANESDKDKYIAPLHVVNKDIEFCMVALTGKSPRVSECRNKKRV